MNLLALARQDVEKYSLKSKLEIAYYLYIKTGQIFKYNPAFKFMDEKECEKAKQERINILNVENFDIICFSWAHAYIDLLKCFGIEAKIGGNNQHAFVEMVIDGEAYQADLTKNGGEIALIKMGLRPLHFNQVVNGEIIDSSIGKVAKMSQSFCEKGILSKELLMEINQKERALHYINTIFNQKAKNSKEANEEYTFCVYREIAKIMNNPEFKLGYVSGRTMIYFLLEKYIGVHYKPNFTHFYNKDKTSFIEIYTVVREGIPYYFAYQENLNGMYELQEVPALYVECLTNTYMADHINNLVILSKPEFSFNSNLGCARS